MSTPNLTDVIRRASEKNIAFSKKWLRLYHYQSATLSDYKSEIEDPKFFFHEQGNRDPQIELLAALDAFAKADSDDGNPPQCRFPSRYKFLDKELGLSEAGFPNIGCSLLEKTLEQHDPQSVTIVFPSTYFGNPASLFGHTFLRLDSAKRGELNSWSINYAANIGDANPFEYIFKGLTGFFKGEYFGSPYYVKIQEYLHGENRDIWEYRLNLTPEESREIVRHVWELGGVYSWYYFFDRNCSYKLLSLIEVARPELELTRQFGIYTIPIDSVRVVREAGLVAEAHYRPARASKIQDMNRQWSSAVVDSGYRLAKGKSIVDNSALDLPLEDRAKAFDFAAEYLQYLYHDQKVERDVYVERFHSILKERSSLPKVDFSVTQPDRPDLGHRSARLGLGLDYFGQPTGEAQVGVDFYGRFAFHSLNDPESGFIYGSGIEFGGLHARLVPATRKFELRRLTFIQVDAIPPISRFFFPLSFQVQVGVGSDQVSKEKFRNFGLFQLNGGLSTQIGRFLISALPGVDFRAGPKLRRGYSLATSIKSGVLVPFGIYSSHLSNETRYGIFGETGFSSTLLWDQRITLGVNWALHFELKRNWILDEGIQEKGIKPQNQALLRMDYFL